MTTAPDLMTAILLDPFDSGPRLVYADWLDEQGEPERATVIRTMVYFNDCFLRECEHALSREYCGTEVQKACHLLQNDIGIEGIGTPGDYYVNRTIDGIKGTYERGFPARLSCSLSQYMGGECECTKANWEANYELPEFNIEELHWASEPTPLIFIDSPQPPSPCCSKCSGTGRIHGLVESVAARWPIVSVTLSGKEPIRSAMYEDRWRWLANEPDDSEGGEVPNSWIGRELYRRLPGYKGGDGIVQPTWSSRESAIIALSNAAVDLARSRVGLPGMKWGKGTI